MIYGADGKLAKPAFSFSEDIVRAIQKMALQKWSDYGEVMREFFYGPLVDPSGRPIYSKSKIGQKIHFRRYDV